MNAEITLILLFVPFFVLLAILYRDNSSKAEAVLKSNAEAIKAFMQWREETERLQARIDNDLESMNGIVEEFKSTFYKTQDMINNL